MTTITSREFNQDASGAKRKAAKGPVFITDRGKPAHVLLSIEDYRHLSAAANHPFISAAEALAQPEPEADFEIDFPRMKDMPRPVDFGID